jgi:hypothetical protein
MKKLLINTATALLMATMVAGCGGNSGGRSGKPVYGPGSTGNIAASTSSTTGGTTPGGGGAQVGTFSAAPAINTARAQFTATTLGDGRVLITGGSDGQGIITRSEVFDPVANSWTDCTSLTANQNDGLMVDPTGTFATARQLHTATLLSTGQVLVAGGLGVERNNAQGQPVFEAMKTAYLFDPTANKFTAAPQLTEGRGWHSAALLTNSKVLVGGGLGAQMTSLTSAEVFDPIAGTWTQVNPGAGGKHTWGAMLTTQGQTVFAGGADVVQGQQGLQLAGFPGQRVERFDATGMAFTVGPNNAGDVIFQGANVISSGKALFVGGQGVSGQQLVVLDTSELYDGGNNTFSAGPTLNVARFGAEVAEVATSSDQLIIGGVDGQGAPTAICELYGAYGNAILGQVSMSAGRVDHRAVTLRDGRILVIAGFDANNAALDTCEFHTR